MIGYRWFRNGDTPRLAEIWRSRSGLRGYVQPMTTTLLERHVLAKPYFERAGLVVATDDNKPIAFAHAGFGPTDDESALSTELGTTVLTVPSPHGEEAAIAGELIRRSEEYLRGKGAKILYGGGIWPLNAFYLGLYGGSELPGILDSDQQQQDFFRTTGYKEVDRTVVLHRELTDFRPTVDREQMQLRRRTRIECGQEPPTKSWWEACTMGDIPRHECQIFLRDEPEAIGTITLTEMDLFGHTWGVRTMGLVDVWVAENHRRQGMALGLISEALRQIAQQGVGLVEVQTMERNGAALAMYEKLGFKKVDGGVVFRKES